MRALSGMANGYPARNRAFVANPYYDLCLYRNGCINTRQYRQLRVTRYLFTSDRQWHATHRFIEYKFRTAQLKK